MTIIQEGKAGKDNTYMGRTINNKLVIYKSQDQLNGQFLNIKINKISPGPLYGEIVEV